MNRVLVLLVFAGVAWSARTEAHWNCPIQWDRRPTGHSAIQWDRRPAGHSAIQWDRRPAGHSAGHSAWTGETPVPPYNFTGLVYQDAAPEPATEKAVSKGLDWLVKQQLPDGSWAGANGAYPTAVTAIAGMALLAEGSTIREGKYAPNVLKAVDWCMKQARNNGQIVSGNQTEQSRHMLPHGLAMYFLASAYGDEEDAGRRKKLEGILTRAADYAEKSQTKRGGWGYVSAADGGDFDESHATVPVVQGLRAARNAGIALPRGVMERGVKYFEDATLPSGGILYSLASAGGDGRPTITAGAASILGNGAVKPAQLLTWVKFLAKIRSVPVIGRVDSTNLLEHFYLSRVIYRFGEDGHRKLDPNAGEGELLRWSDYRKKLYTALQQTQQNDGSWSDTYVGPVYNTSLALIVLQLEKETLPLTSR